MSSTRKREILTHSAKLFSERGIAGTTVRDIADAVGILSGSLYHYFGSKDAIAAEIVHQFLADLNEGYERGLAPATTARERLEQLIRCSLETAARHPYASEICQNENILHSDDPEEPEHEAVMRMREFWGSTIAQGVVEGELRADVDQGRLYQMLREAVWSCVRANRPHLQEVTESLQHDLSVVFLDGIALAEPAGRPAAPGAEQAVPGAEPAHAADDPSAEADIREEVRALQAALAQIQARIS